MVYGQKPKSLKSLWLIAYGGKRMSGQPLALVISHTLYALYGCIQRDTCRIAFDTAEGSLEAVQNDRPARPQRVKTGGVPSGVR
jgi:hypothetical protein